MRTGVTGRTRTLIVALMLAVPTILFAQGSAALRQAEQAYAELDYGRAIVVARRALDERLGRVERIRAYELLGFSYGALDSTRQGVAAFRELIFLDPDREPDPVRVSPRISSLYGSALGQVLVVRRVRVDSASFVAGRGSLPVRFQVSRASRVTARAVGADTEVKVDSQSVAGEGRIDWSGLTELGEPVPPGRYQLIIEAAAGRERYATQAIVHVSHVSVDTAQHMTELPGYRLLPEVERPPRNWRPLGIATLYTAFASGLSLALQNTQLGSASREEVGAVSFAVVLTGLVMSLKKPDPRPVPSGILYNQLLREQLAARNAQIADQNVARRRQIRLSIVPVVETPP